MKRDAPRGPWAARRGADWVGIVVGTVLAAMMQVAASTDGTTLRVEVLLVVVAAVMAGVGLLATLGPARRALRIQPTEALRSD